MRITDRDIEAVIKQINEATGNPIESYSKDNAGRFRANIGCYTFYACHGVRALDQIISSGGGVKRILTASTNRELYNMLHSFKSGISTGCKK